jgi:hypothetical protein
MFLAFVSRANKETGIKIIRYVRYIVAVMSSLIPVCSVDKAVDQIRVSLWLRDGFCRFKRIFAVAASARMVGQSVLTIRQSRRGLVLEASYGDSTLFSIRSSFDLIPALSYSGLYYMKPPLTMNSVMLISCILANYSGTTAHTAVKYGSDPSQKCVVSLVVNWRV